MQANVAQRPRHLGVGLHRLVDVELGGAHVRQNRTGLEAPLPQPGKLAFKAAGRDGKDAELGLGEQPFDGGALGDPLQRRRLGRLGVRVETDHAHLVA
ncbi:MAG: hypothetical protein M0Z88_08250 [Actinomycetota bacterium]|nr:hypothetical protein [Actinomycetota bacterium]